jgi:predicted ATPase
MIPGSSWDQRRKRSRDPFDFAEESILETLRATAPIEPEGSDDSPFPWHPKGLAAGSLIGRTAELLDAANQIKEVVTNWGGKQVLLLGPRGIGTSTFVARLKSKARSIDPDLIWAQAYCREEPTRPYSVFGRLLRNLLKIPPQLDDWMAGERFQHEVVERFGQEDSADAIDVARLVAFLVEFKIEGSPYLSPTADDARTLVPRASQALTRLFTAFASKNPLVLVLDEAHQATAPLLALIDLVSEGIAHTPILLLLVGQPELRDAQTARQGRHVIELGLLGRADCTKVLRTLLTGVDNVPEDLVARVVDKSGGNPYAIRTIVRYLHETGVLQPADGGKRWTVDETAFFDLDIPDTLHGVANARLQALAPIERAVLQRAAVVGPSFWFGTMVMLQRLGSDFSILGPEGVGKDPEIVELKKLLQRLVSREILSKSPDKALSGEEMYTFHSELDREILYEQCPARTRHRFHRMVAHWLELQPARFVESQLAMIARHLEIGGESLKAAQYYQRAGKRSRINHHNDQAVTFYDEALRLVGEEEVPNRINIHFALGNLHALLGNNEQAIESFREMLRYAWTMRSRSKGAVALNKLGQIFRRVGDYDASREHLVKALQLFRSVHDVRGIAGVLDDMGQLHWLQGDNNKALLTFDRSKKLRTQLKDPRGLSLTLHYIGCTHLGLGNHDAAEKHLLDALALRRKLRDLSGMSITLNNLGVIYWNRGDAAKAQDVWLESLHICKEEGNRPVTAMLMSNLAEAHMAQGDYDSAAPYLEEAEQISERGGDRRTLASVLINAAKHAMGMGKHAAAIACAHRAVDEARSIGNLRLAGMAEVALGNITVGTSKLVGETRGIEDGLAHMLTGIETLANAESDVDQAAALEELSSVYRKLERAADAEATLKRAEAIYSRLGVRPTPTCELPWVPIETVATVAAAPAEKPAATEPGKSAKKAAKSKEKKAASKKKTKNILGKKNEQKFG